MNGDHQESRRVIFDCPIFVQSLLGTGPSFACFELAEVGEFALLMSPAVWDEVNDVLNRPGIRKGRPDITQEIIDTFIGRIQVVAQIVDDPPEVFDYSRDPKDEPYLNLAIAAGAAFIVSRDNDLLDLMDPDSADGQRLRQLAPELMILTPVGLLRTFAP